MWRWGSDMGLHGENLPGLEEFLDKEFRQGSSIRVAATINKSRQFQSSKSTRPERMELWEEFAIQITDATDRRQSELLKALGNGQVPPETCIASGTTYLAQLLAHDVVHSVRSRPNDRLPLANAVTQPAVMQTLYGEGPERSPHLFGKAGGYESIKFDIGELKKQSIPYASDFVRNGPGCPLAIGQAILADERNDSNAMVNQLTVLWMRFHNWVVDELQSTQFIQVIRTT